MVVIQVLASVALVLLTVALTTCWVGVATVDNDRAQAVCERVVAITLPGARVCALTLMLVVIWR